MVAEGPRKPLGLHSPPREEMRAERHREREGKGEKRSERKVAATLSEGCWIDVMIIERFKSALWLLWVRNKGDVPVSLRSFFF